MMALFRLRDKGRFPTPNTDGWPTLTSSCATWTSPAIRRRPADPHAAVRRRRAGIGCAPDAGRQRRAAYRRRAEAKLAEHQAEVEEIYERVIHAQQPMYYTWQHCQRGAGTLPRGTGRGRTGAAPASNLTRFLDERAPRLAQRWPATNSPRPATFPAFSRKGLRAAGDSGASRRRRQARRRHAGYFRAQPLLRRRSAALPRTAGRDRRALPAGRRPAGGWRGTAALLPPPDAAHPEREPAGGRAHLRYAGQNLGAGRQHYRRRLRRRRQRGAAARFADLSRRSTR